MTQSEQTNEKPTWVKLKPAELEKIIVELAKQGKTTAEIGLILRDAHGVPKTKLLGKRISQILRDANVKTKSGLEISKSKIDNLQSHLERNKHDKKAKRSLIKNSWVLLKLQKAN